METRVRMCEDELYSLNLWTSSVENKFGDVREGVVRHTANSCALARLP